MDISDKCIRCREYTGYCRLIRALYEARDAKQLEGAYQAIRECKRETRDAAKAKAMDSIR